MTVLLYGLRKLDDLSGTQQFFLAETARHAKRKDLPPLPDFHAPRHTAAIVCEHAEEARDLLRHKNSNVTRSIYRGHFNDKHRELLRARLEARHGSSQEATDRDAG